MVPIFTRINPTRRSKDAGINARMQKFRKIGTIEKGTTTTIENITIDIIIPVLSLKLLL